MTKEVRIQNPIFFIALRDYQMLKLLAMGNLRRISVVIMTDGNILPETLASLIRFDEVIIVYTGVEPYTSPLPNAHVFIRSFSGDLTRLFGVEKASHNWILSIDSDEVLTPELIREINAAKLNEKTIYSIPFKNYFNGRFIRGCGWYPDRHIRLFNRKKTNFQPVRVHSSVEKKDLNVKNLQGHILHYSYRSIRDFLHKMQLYSDLFAEEYTAPRRPSIGKALCHGLFAFVKSYFLKRGFLDGKEGWIISAYQGHTTFYKYLKVMEMRPPCS